MQLKFLPADARDFSYEALGIGARNGHLDIEMRTQDIPLSSLMVTARAVDYALCLNMEDFNVPKSCVHFLDKHDIMFSTLLDEIKDVSSGACTTWQKWCFA